MSQRGSMLVEAIVAMAITVVIVAVVAQTLIVMAQQSQTVDQRLRESTGVSFISSYFVPDVESAATLTRRSFASCPIAGATAVAQFQRSDGVSAYGVKDVSGERKLIRRFCGAETLEAVVAGALDAAFVGDVSCVPACAIGAAARPETVSMTVTFESGMSRSFTAARRVNETP